VDEAEEATGDQRKAGCAHAGSWRAANAAAARRTMDNGTAPASFGGRSRCVRCTGSLHFADSRSRKAFRSWRMSSPPATSQWQNASARLVENGSAAVGWLRRLLPCFERGTSDATKTRRVTMLANQGVPFSINSWGFRRLSTQVRPRRGATPNSPPAHAIKLPASSVQDRPYLPYLPARQKERMKNVEARRL
jgi:hypothetical protein